MMMIINDDDGDDDGDDDDDDVMMMIHSFCLLSSRLTAHMSHVIWMSDCILL